MSINAILILNYNDANTTILLANKMFNYNNLDLILIVDNKSTDNSFQELKKIENEKIRVIQTLLNNGYAFGNNFGLRYLDENYDVRNVIISNPDIEVSEESISNMLEFLDTHHGVSAVSGRIYDTQENPVENFAWKLPTYGMLLSSTFLTLYKIFNGVLKYGHYYNDKDYQSKSMLFVDVITGCFFVIRMNSIKDVGYFDERTFLYGEENILFYKLKMEEYKSVILLNEAIIHHHGVSINKNIKKEIARQNILLDSNLLYLRKYLKVGIVKISLYKVFFNIGKYEKELIGYIRNFICLRTHK